MPITLIVKSYIVHNHLLEVVKWNAYCTGLKKCKNKLKKKNTD